jgi:replicative DNA helicase
MMDNIPKNLSAEKSFLCCLLTDKEVFYKIDELKIEDFYDKRNRIVFKSIKDLIQKSEVVEINNLKEHIGSRIKSIYLAEILNSSSSSTEIDKYIKAIRTKSILRRIINAGEKIKQYGFDEESDIKEVIDMASKELGKSIDTDIEKSTIRIGDELVNVFNSLNERIKNKSNLIGVTSGFKKIDNILHGFKKTELLILAARPSVGKTSLVLDFAMEAAKDNKKVFIISCEQSKEQLVNKMLGVQSMINPWKIESGNLGEDELDKISKAMGELNEMKIFIDDVGGQTPEQIKIKARGMKIKEGVDLLIIDYLQLLRWESKNDNRAQEISKISNEIKNLAKELKIPIIALSQLNREIEKRTDKTPKLSDLRESGSLEQDADIVMFLNREIIAENQEEIRDAELIIAKNRSGPTGKLGLRFNEILTTFTYKNNDQK